MTEADFFEAEDAYRNIKRDALAAVASDFRAHRGFVSRLEEVTVRLMNASKDFTREELRDAKQSAYTTGTEKFDLSSALSTVEMRSMIHDLLEHELKLSEVPSQSSEQFSSFLTNMKQQLQENTSKLARLKTDKEELETRVSQLLSAASSSAVKSAETKILEQAVHDREGRVRQLVVQAQSLEDELRKQEGKYISEKSELARLAQAAALNEQRVSAVQDEIFLLETEQTEQTETAEKLQFLIDSCAEELRDMQHYQLDDLGDFMRSRDQNEIPSSEEINALERQVKLLRQERFNSLRR